MIDVLKQARRKAEVPFTMRDGLMGAGLMIGGTIALSAGGIWLRNHGWPDFGEAIKSLAFSASLTLTLPTMWLKGQPWRAQVAIVGGTLVILVIIGLASSHART